MTRNQIDYMRLQEEKRSNQAKEFETNRANVANEENVRKFNVASLDLRAKELGEAIRHNQANEEITLRNYERQSAEKERSNRAIEEETNRSNLARETETSRHNRATEDLGISQLGAALQQASAAITSAGASAVSAQASLLAAETRGNELISLDNYRAEQIALEIAKLQEQSRANQSRETETTRHNMATEGISAMQLDIQGQQTRIQQLLAQARQRELELQGLQWQENVRHNQATESNTQRGQNFSLIGQAINSALKGR